MLGNFDYSVPISRRRFFQLDRSEIHDDAALQSGVSACKFIRIVSDHASRIPFSVVLISKEAKFFKRAQLILSRSVIGFEKTRRGRASLNFEAPLSSRTVFCLPRENSAALYVVHKIQRHSTLFAILFFLLFLSYENAKLHSRIFSPLWVPRGVYKVIAASIWKD